jgi:methyltransferase (TIGR00027 family)
VQKNRSSETAEGVAAYRAMETMRPKNDRVINDPYATLFLGTKWKKMITSPIHSWLAKMIGNLKYPGFYGSLIARVRFMNECIKECFPTDHTQLVILGAGYNMSAYCFQKILRNAKVFEVDYPSTQKDKLIKIRKHLNNIPDNITYIPLNFETDDIKATLIMNGYVPSEKTLFIWEGVTYFLEQESVEKSLNFIVDNSAKGSNVAFDYFPPEVIDGTTSDRLGKEMNKLVKKIGEPYKFGIEPDDIENFLKHYRFKHIYKSSASEVRNTYFHGDNKNRKVSILFNFVRATTY